MSAEAKRLVDRSADRRTILASAKRTEPSVDFNFREIDLGPGANAQEENIYELFLDFQIRLFEWIDCGNSALAKCVRMQSAKYFLIGEKNQTRLGDQIGVGKAAVSKSVGLLSQQFDFHEILVKTKKIRSAATRAKLSKICKERHNKASGPWSNYSI
jgi:hypothetical protein